MKKFFLPAIGALLALFTCASASTYAETAAAPRHFAHPERLRYDSQCLTIDGHDTFVFSGAFHYFRCPPELWADRFQKIKDAGFNAVETYVAWNWHERSMPASLEDFSKIDLHELEAWLTMAEQYGLDVIIRPGPYICAEWDTGGFPQWLLTKKPAQPLRKEAWLRTDDPVYLDWCKHWYKAVCPVIARHQLTRRPPGQHGVILFQLENEYDFARLPAEVMNNQVRTLAQTAAEAGIDVPMFTCWTRPIRGSQDPVLREVFDTCNFYPRWDVDGIGKEIDELRRQQPGAPLMTTELQGGWFAQVGGKLAEEQPGLTPAQIQNLTLFAFEHGDTLTNYYMLFGGTNLDDTAARSLIASYDYDAPIREHGGVGERYARVAAIGHMLREHGPRLARAVGVPCDVAAPDKDVQAALRRAPDGSRYVFVRTNQHDAPRAGVVRVKPQDGSSAELAIPYQLEPFGSMVLYLPPRVDDPRQGEWLPKAVPAPVRPTTGLPSPVKPARWMRFADPLPLTWTPLKAGQSLDDVGIYGSHLTYYHVTAKAGERLKIVLPKGDAAVTNVSGEALPITEPVTLPPDTAQFKLLYEDAGHPNGGAGMEAGHGLRAVRNAGAADADASDGPIPGWQMKPAPAFDEHAAAPLLDSTDGWQAVDISGEEASQLETPSTALFRATLDLSPKRLARGELTLTFSRVDDEGRIYVNGQLLGSTEDWAQEYAFDAAKLLHAGRNQIAVLVRNIDGSGGLGAVSLTRDDGAGPEPGDAALEVASTELAHGLQLSSASFDPATWQKKDAAGEYLTFEDDREAMLEWRRVTFELPERDPKVWVPWHAHLEASGNGFVYLNGHCIGRTWQQGPQRDFYLPECWLQFGPGKQNVLAMSLRPLDKGVSLHSPQIVPDNAFAEVRP